MTQGLFDIQINGGFGHDFTTDPASIWLVGERLAQRGITRFLPTLITSPRGTVERALEALAAGSPDGYQGAEPIGLHVEGPMLSPTRRGTHPEEFLELPSLGLIEGWTKAAGVAMVTLAPELPGALEVIEALVEAGVVVALGHSDATYGQALRGVEAGASTVTHLFNGMRPFDHREPGLVGAAFDDERLTAGLIVDGIHVHPAAVRTAWNLLGPDRLVMVSDSMAAAGIGEGEFRIGTVEVTVAGGRVMNRDGQLAGCSVLLDEAARNLEKFAGVSKKQAFAAASINPARLLNLD